MTDSQTCTRCGRCQKACLLLQAQGQDVTELAATPAQRECMLCGCCDRACPHGIKGTDLVLSARRAPGRLAWRQWLPRLEKKYYPFRAYPSKAANSLIFAGCYFPAFFPQSMRALQSLAAQHHVACAFDCCGKPLRELGREAEAEQVLRRLRQQLQRLQVQELITICPNCYVYLQNRLDFPVYSIYEKLAEWNIPTTAAPQGSLFIPCPDRASQLQLRQISRLFPLSRLGSITNVQCCGLGGGAAAFAPARTEQLAAEVKRQVGDNCLYTYCASCAGQFQRQGLKQVRHLLPWCLAIDETPDTAHSLTNRLYFKRKTI